MQKTEVKNKISLASLQYLPDSNKSNRVPVVVLLLFKFLASVAASAMTSAEVSTSLAIFSGVRPF
jgi:hypothetical protein